MEITLQLYRKLFSNRAYVRSVSEGAVFLAASTIAIFAAVTYATVHASNYVTDFVLSRVGPFNGHPAFGEGCPLLAQSGHADLNCTCPLLGVKRT